MTRSSARRRNRNARAIAALVPAKDALHHRITEGAFTPHDARRWVHNASPYLWPEPPQETNWELVAEKLNVKARFYFEVRQPGFVYGRPPSPIVGFILAEM